MMEDRIEALETGVSELEDGQDRFVDLLLGPPLLNQHDNPIRDVEGNVVRDVEKGIKYRVDYVYEKMSGGFRIKFSKSQIAMFGVVMAALITATATVIAAAIGG